MKNRLFRHYNKVKYWLRVRHWRGANVHSPFMFALVREAILKRRKNIHRIDRRLLSFLVKRGVRRKYAILICSIYAHLKLKGYVYGYGYREGTGLVVVPEQIGRDDCMRLVNGIQRRKEAGGCVCLVLFRLYQNRRKYHLWREIVRDCDAVTVDLYNIGFVFFDPRLKKQGYKMKV